MKASIAQILRDLDRVDNRLMTLDTELRRLEPSRPERSIFHQVDLSAAILALAALADSGVEHYRGSFNNRTMYAPLGVGALTVAAALSAFFDRRTEHSRVRDAIYVLSGLTGLVGTGFHAYNIAKRPGGLSWANLFYAAPIGAPAALILAGLLGHTAENLRAAPPKGTLRVLGLKAGRFLRLVATLGLFGSVGEAGLMHFRGAFQNPAMLLPVSLPPLAAILLGMTAARSGPRLKHVTRWMLKLTAALGLAGVGFHAYGISRAMGGWKNWSQNVLNGPPLPAPPSFTGLALAGLSALRLIEGERDE